MMNVAAIVSLRNLPLLSTYGLSMFIFYAIAALLFFIPAALISAELASLFSEEGGSFAWIRRALGRHVAFLCEWISFITTVASMTLTVVFLVASLLLPLYPNLSANPLIICCTVVVVIWLASWLALRGTHLTSSIVAWMVLAGTLFPVALLFALSIFWLCIGSISQVSFSWGRFLPDFSHFSNVAFLPGVMFAFAGIEMSAFYVKDVHEPRKNYPRAIFFSTLLILTVSFLGSFSIAIVLPASDIRIEAGIVQALTFLLESMHVGWLAPCVAFLIALGGMAYVFAWIAGPVRGLYAVRHTGLLPPFLQKTDRNGMPTTLLIVQASMITVLAALFLFMPHMSLCFWLINVSSSVMILLAYACLFTTGTVLRHKMPAEKRLYIVPGGKFGMPFLGIVGIANAIFCIIISFFIPAELSASMSQQHFAWAVLVMTTVLLSPPLIFAALHKPHWMAKE
jgi:amino acid transporter